MSKESNIQREVWALSETKETAVLIFQNLIESQSEWLSAVNGMADPVTTKKKFVITMYSAYQIASPSFRSYLKRSVDSDKYDDYVEKFKLLGLKGADYSTEELYDISSHLHEWYVSEGYAKLNDAIIEVNDLKSEIN